jgi:hypothetical protein
VQKCEKSAEITFTNTHHLPTTGGCGGRYMIALGLPNRDRLRFFDKVGHQTTNASMGNKYFFTKNNVIVRLTKIMNRANKNWAHF